MLFCEVFQCLNICTFNFVKTKRTFVFNELVIPFNKFITKFVLYVFLSVYTVYWQLLIFIIHNVFMKCTIISYFTFAIF